MAALAEPAHPPEASTWNNDDLADDVAILSYENALKAHARYRPSQASQVSDRSLTQPADPEPFCYEEASSNASAYAPYPEALPIPGREPVPTTDQVSSFLRTSPLDRNLKDASITIRMSKAECAQLHRRAAEAGLSVSAYLRSCTFEAESLRAMVKDTMAQLRSVTSQIKPADAAPSRFRSLVRWLARLFTPWRSSQRTPRA
jgi:hypothetical protein